MQVMRIPLRQGYDLVHYECAEQQCWFLSGPNGRISLNPARKPVDSRALAVLYSASTDNLDVKQHKCFKLFMTMVEMFDENGNLLPSYYN